MQVANTPASGLGLCVERGMALLGWTRDSAGAAIGFEAVPPTPFSSPDSQDRLGPKSWPPNTLRP